MRKPFGVLGLLAVAVFSAPLHAGMTCTIKLSNWDVIGTDGKPIVNYWQYDGKGSCDRTFASGGGAGTAGRTRENQGGSGPGGRGGEISENLGTLNEGQVNAGIATCPVANPIIIATGNKIEPELDFATQGEMPLFLERKYNFYHIYEPTLFGYNWISNFDYRLSFRTPVQGGYSGGCNAWPSRPECTTAATHTQVLAFRPDGRTVLFNKAADGTFYEDKPSPISKIVPQGDGTWLVVFEDNLTELYSRGGYPLWIQDEHGIRWTYAYGGLNGTQVQSVTHTSGRSVQFVWVDDELREIRDPAGNPYRFTYYNQKAEVGFHTLKTVTLPGLPATTITYHYAGEGGEPANGGLTGKSYNGVRYSRFSYENGRAVSSEHADGVEKYTFAYTPGTDGALTVLETNPLDKQATYQFKNGKLLSITGHASLNCPLAGSSNTYDANGNLDTATDFKGNKVVHRYGPSGRLQERIEAYGKPEARTTTYVWDDVRNRVTSITMSDASGPSTRTEFTYTTDGRLASEAVVNLSTKVPASLNQTRQVAYAYTKHPNGLLATMVVDGPLTADTVTYTYDAYSNLTEVRNSLGHATTYSNYNALGRPGRVVTPNGAIREIFYDERGRVKEDRAIVGGVAQATINTYDGSGRLSSVLTPDGSQVTREFDAAWRVWREYQPLSQGGYAVRRFTYNKASLITEAITEFTTALYKPTAAPTLQTPGLGVSGNYTVTWSGISGSEYYVLEELPPGGAWGVVLSENAGSKIFGGRPAGNYSYRVQACNAAGCTSTSNVGTTTVLYAPSAVASLSAPAQSTAGSFTVSWTGVPTADRYVLQESYNGQSWATVYDAGGGSAWINGRNAGTYDYRVLACNQAGCGLQWSSAVRVTEIDPPGAPPNVFGPAVNEHGSYTVTWTAVGGTDTYQLEEYIPNGSWTQITQGGATSFGVTRSIYTTAYYRVRGCNAAGCGAYSPQAVVQATVYGAQFVSQSFPDTMVPSSQGTATVVMRNTGNTPWSAGMSFNLGSQREQDNTRWGMSRVATPGVVNPGQTATFQFTITAPSGAAGGQRAWQWRMVRDGYTWFGDYTPDNVGIWLEAPEPGCGTPRGCN